jgi:acetyl-CoA carboxylase carboxyltransferase component
MNHQEILDDLDRRRERARAMGGPAKLQKRKDAGQLNAWERLEHAGSGQDAARRQNLRVR